MIWIYVDARFRKHFVYSKSMQINTASTKAAVEIVTHYAGVLSQLMLAGGFYLAPIALWFLWFGLRRDFKWKILHILYILVCVYVFAVFVGGGILVGSNFGYGAFGAIGGVFGFWALFEGMTQIKLRQEFRERV